MGGKAGFNRIASHIVATVDPGEDSERRPGDQHIAVADDGPARLIDDFRLDGIGMIVVTMHGLRDSRIDLHFYRAVGADGDFPLHHHFGRIVRARPPDGEGPDAPPLVPAGIPGVI